MILFGHGLAGDLAGRQDGQVSDLILDLLDGLAGLPLDLLAGAVDFLLRLRAGLGDDFGFGAFAHLVGAFDDLLGLVLGRSDALAILRQHALGLATRLFSGLYTLLAV